MADIFLKADIVTANFLHHKWMIYQRLEKPDICHKVCVRHQNRILKKKQSNMAEKIQDGGHFSIDQYSSNIEEILKIVQNILRHLNIRD
jgi:hypothetical protein